AGDAVGQRRLAGVGKPDETDVGDALEDESEHALLARVAGVGAFRRAVRRALEMRVTPAAVAALAQDHALAVLDDLGDDVAGLLVGDDGAERNTEDRGFALATVAVLALAVVAPLGARVRFVVVVDEVVRVVLSHEHQVAALAAVTAIGSAPRLVFLAPEADAPSAAVAGKGFDDALVDE